MGGRRWEGREGEKGRRRWEVKEGEVKMEGCKSILEFLTLTYMRLQFCDVNAIPRDYTYNILSVCQSVPRSPSCNV